MSYKNQCKNYLAIRITIHVLHTLNCPVVTKDMDQGRAKPIHAFGPFGRDVTKINSTSTHVCDDETSYDFRSILRNFEPEGTSKMQTFEISQV